MATPLPTPPGQLPPELEQLTKAWAEAEHTVTPEMAAEHATDPPWGHRPDIAACTGQGGTWWPDTEEEYGVWWDRLAQVYLGGRCELPDRTCGGVSLMHGACPPAVTPPIEPDPVDPWVEPSIPPTGQPTDWLLFVAAAVLLG